VRGDLADNESSYFNSLTAGVTAPLQLFDPKEKNFCMMDSVREHFHRGDECEKKTSGFGCSCLPQRRFDNCGTRQKTKRSFVSNKPTCYFFNSPNRSKQWMNLR